MSLALFRILRLATPTAVVATILFISYVVMICDSRYFYKSDNNPLDALCHPIYGSIFPESTHQGFPMWPSAILLTIFLLLIPIFIMVFPNSVAVTPLNHHPGDGLLKGRKVQASRFEKLCVILTKGDPVIWFWALILILGPITIVLLVVSTDESDNNGLDLWIRRFANVTGYCATISLSFFMVPVAKQSPLLVAIGWSPIHALGLHVWAGRICWVMTSIHAILYILKFGFYPRHDKDTDTEDTGRFIWSDVAIALFPMGGCWAPESLWAFKEDSHCYRQWRNFTGVISALSLFLLIMTSWNKVRRWNYRFFYVSHIIFGSMMLLFAILHFYWIAIYVVPGLIYYLACSTPIVVQQFANYFLDRGTILKRTRIISKSNGCLEMVFATTSMRHGYVIAPAYVRICVPEISIMWHPFTIPHTTTIEGGSDREELKLLIRRYGYFTTALYKRLQQESTGPPTILVDGYYQGSDWATSALKHDTVLLVAGGIGVTPMLPLLELLYRHIRDAAEESLQRTTNVFFHWYCRDEGLIRHVLKEYLIPLLQDLDADEVAPTTCHFHIMVHFTAREVDDQEPFLVIENDEKCAMITTSATFPSETESETKIFDELFEDDPNEKPHGCNPILEDPTKDLILDYVSKNSTKGVSIKAASFSYLNDSRITIYMGLVAFVLAYTLFMYWYITEVREHTSRIFFRGYSMYALILLLLLASVAIEFYRRGSVIVEGDSYTPVIEEKFDSEANSHHKLPELPLYGRFGYNASIYFDVRNGRPLIHDIVRPAVEAELPGAFYCGPQKLLNTIQKMIASERRKVKGRLAPKCCTYQEHFEM